MDFRPRPRKQMWSSMCAPTDKCKAKSPICVSQDQTQFVFLITNLEMSMESGFPKKKKSAVVHNICVSIKKKV